MSLGNPYVIDRPLAASDLFIGRYRTLARVSHFLRQGNPLLLLFGSVRVGKTSFLARLAKDLPADTLVIWLDWLKLADQDADVALQRLLDGVTHELQVLLERPEGSLDDLLAATGSRRLLVLLDGGNAVEAAGPAQSAMIAGWQGWLSQHPRVQSVIALRGQLDGMARSSATLISTPSADLDCWQMNETEELLTRLARDDLSYEFGAIRRIWQLTSGHPYLVQLCGHTLFDMCRGMGRASFNEVERAVPEVIIKVSPALEEVWQGCSQLARVVVSLANELMGRHGVITFRDLCDMVRVRGLEVSEPEIQQAVAELCAHGLLFELSQDGYRFHSEIVRNWLLRFKPLPDVLGALRSNDRLWSRASRRIRLPSWSTIRLWSGALAAIMAVVLLWSMRGSAQEFVLGSSATATPAMIATRNPSADATALGRIAYMARDKPDAAWDVWVMWADGADPVRLTDDPANDTSPCWSPDGQQLAFVSDREGNKEIYIIKSDGKDLVNLTRNGAEDWTPTWSPDGTEIAFASNRDGNWEIYVSTPDGSQVRRLTRSPGADYFPAYSPDGQQIAFCSNRDGNWEIYVMNRDGGAVKRLTKDEATDFRPAWSPDGKTIAFESYRDGNMEIYTMAPDGSAECNISNDPYSNDQGPSWVRDGSRLVYYSNRDGGWDIFTMTVEGTEKNNLTLSPAFEQDPVWHE